ncbi:MAG: M55 family metallopeptidase [Cellulosilyticaceae bacterium]
MKIYISADVEGITGVSTWAEATDDACEQARLQLTKEVVAACEGAIQMGADEIVVKDAHGNGKNIIPHMLPKQVKLIAGWSNHPFNMVEGLDESFDGVIFVGYHSDALSNGSNLAHTLAPDRIRGIWLNEQPASEWTLYTYCAHMLQVPVVMVSGDGELIRNVRKMDTQIATVAVHEGFGGATVSIHPDLAVERIEKAVMQGIANLGKYIIQEEESYTLNVAFRSHQDAYKYSFYPGAWQVDEYTIGYTSTNYMDVLTLLLFM